MKNQLFPKEFINTTVEHYTFRIRKKTNAIYLIVITALSLILLALPFIQVNVSKNASGIINTRSQRYQLVAPVSGIIKEQHLVENKTIDAGDPLCLFDTSTLDKEIDQVKNRITELETFISDLNHLDENRFEQVASDVLAIQLLQHQSNLERLDLDIERTKRVYLRQKLLFQEKVIAEVDYERDEALYKQAKAEKRLYQKQKQNEWKETLLRYTIERDELTLRKERLQEERQKYVLAAPSKGELQNIVPVVENQFIAAGTQLGEISPDTTLLAICYVSTKDVGLLKEGMKGSFRVDAFNANEWGFVEGEISKISTDAYIQNDQSFFKVECLLDQHFLSLQNGFKGEFKKGMTIQASFQVAERTLFQLLYDGMDDWLNPFLK